MHWMLVFLTIDQWYITYGLEYCHVVMGVDDPKVFPTPWYPQMKKDTVVFLYMGESNSHTPPDVH